MCLSPLQHRVTITQGLLASEARTPYDQGTSQRSLTRRHARGGDRGPGGGLVPHLHAPAIAGPDQVGRVGNEGIVNTKALVRMIEEQQHPLLACPASAALSSKRHDIPVDHGGDPASCLLGEMCDVDVILNTEPIDPAVVEQEHLFPIGVTFNEGVELAQGLLCV